MEIAQPHAFVAKTQLLDHPQARRVLRSDVDLDPMKPQRDERMIAGGSERQWHNPLSCNGFGHPVTR
jgi:hypothetical protein